MQAETTSDTHRPPTLDAVIRQRVKELRQERGWSQDELARRLMAKGFPGWSRAVVSAMETRGRRMSASDLVELAGVFSLPVVELMRTDSRTVSLTDGAVVGASLIKQLFSGQTVGPLQWKKIDLFVEETPANVLAFAQRLLIDELVPEDLRWTVATQAKGELELYLARRLNVHPRVVAAVAFSLWGHSATEEREVRTTGNPKRRQHASRAVHRSIRDFLEQRDLLGPHQREDS